MTNMCQGTSIYSGNGEEIILPENKAGLNPGGLSPVTNVCTAV
jgi:hypothetical protein